MLGDAGDDSGSRSAWQASCDRARRAAAPDRTRRTPRWTTTAGTRTTG